MPDGFPLLLLVGFFVIMWLLFIRPQQRRQRELANMQGSLEVGDEVMLTSGVYGVLHEIDEESVLLDVADGVVIRVARAAIGRLVTIDDEPTELDEVDADQVEANVDDQPDDLSSSPDAAAPNRDRTVPEEN